MSSLSKTAHAPLRCAENTKASIVHAARELFVAKGYGSVSMSDIARVAGVNQSLIHHHFGSKAALWSAVKSSFRTEEQNVWEQLMDDSLPRNDFIETLVRAVFMHVSLRPDLARLNAWKALEPKATDIVAADIEDAERLRDRIGVLQKRGLLRGDIEAETLLTAVTAMVFHWFQHRDETLSWWSQGHAGDALYLDGIVKLLVQGMSPQATQRLPMSSD